jgi:hypothetical protein
VGLREKNVVHDRLTRFVRRQESYQPDVSTFGVWVNFFPHFSLLVYYYSLSQRLEFRVKKKTFN